MWRTMWMLLACALCNPAAAVRKRRCDKLRLQKRWADEDLARSTAGADALRLRARRQAEALAVECPA